nr:histidine-rich glycoprotein-like [Penaeus vannamei]
MNIHLHPQDNRPLRQSPSGHRPSHGHPPRQSSSDTPPRNTPLDKTFLRHTRATQEHPPKTNPSGHAPQGQPPRQTPSGTTPQDTPLDKAPPSPSRHAPRDIPINRQTFTHSESTPPLGHSPYRQAALRTRTQDTSRHPTGRGTRLPLGHWPASTIPPERPQRLFQGNNRHLTKLLRD